MSKERLKEFKDYIDFLDDSQDMQDHGRFVDTLHSLYEDGWFDWIFLYAIEQAGRVQELEETVEDYKAVNKELHQRGRKVRKQNKRYREALEFYADEDNYKTTGEKTYIGHGDYTEEIWIPVDVDSGKKARQALDGEE